MFSVASELSGLRLFKKRRLDPSKLFVDFAFSRYVTLISLMLLFVVVLLLLLSVVEGGGGRIIRSGHF